MNNESGVGPVPGFGRIEASIFGESALIDRETGRVYWECGGITNTLYESFAPKLDQFGAEHAQATLLTLVITLAFLSVLSGWLQKGINSYYYNNGPSLTSQTLSVLIILAEWTIFLDIILSRIVQLQHTLLSSKRRIKFDGIGYVH
jgi:hypothetical protein